MSTILSAGGFDLGGKVIEKVTGSDKATKFASSINPLSKEDTSASKSEKKRLQSIRQSGQDTAGRILGGATRPRKKAKASNSLINNTQSLV
jgi:hypothetical protein